MPAAIVPRRKRARPVEGGRPGREMKMYPQEPHEYEARYEAAMDRADSYVGSLEDELERAEAAARQTASEARAATLELEDCRKRTAELEAENERLRNAVGVALAGYRNLVEIGVLPHGYREDAQAMIRKLEETVEENGDGNNL